MRKRFARLDDLDCIRGDHNARAAVTITRRKIRLHVQQTDGRYVSIYMTADAAHALSGKLDDATQVIDDREAETMERAA